MGSIARERDVLAITETGSNEAIRQGRAHAESSASRLVICRVTDSDEPSDLVADATTVFVTRRGELAAIVMEEATARNVRLITIEAGDPHGLRSSAAERVVRHSPCSVLVTRPPYGLRVVVATDLSIPSHPAIEAGVREARRRNVPITVIHCVESGDAVREATSILASTLSRLECEAELAVVHGPALDSILRALDGVGADLLVIAAHGHRGVVATLLGSTAEALVRAAPCSVLVIRV